MKPLEQHILHIMSTQSEGYLISPDSAAFSAAGLDDEEANLKALQALHKSGHVEFVTEETDFEDEELVQMEGAEEGMMDRKVTVRTELTDAGWSLTSKGRSAI